MIGKIFAFIITAVILFSVFYQSFNASAHRSVSLENITFTTNNTYYALAYHPTNLDLKLYYFQNTTYQIPASNVVANTTHVKIYTNGTTVCYSNITAGCNYYASYTWYPMLTVWGMNWDFIVILIVLLIGFLIAIKLHSMAKAK